MAKKKKTTTDEILTTVNNDNRPAKGRGGKYNFPCAQPPKDPGLVSGVLSRCLKWYDMGMQRAETADEISKRVRFFFEYCMDNGERPTVEKLCLCLGIPRGTLSDWEHENSARGGILKAAKNFLAAYDAELVTTGEMPAVPWIFRAKNYYGMKDIQDVNIAAKPGVEYTDATPSEIVARYKSLPED